MSAKYKIYHAEYPYFVTCTVVEWVDLFTRQAYRDVVLDGLRYAQAHKGLQVFAYCLMTNHLHLIARAPDLTAVLRDFKKFTARELVRQVEQHPQESRRNWLKWMFYANGERNPNNQTIQVWQNGSHPIELNTAMKYQQRLNYLHQNPVRAGFCHEPEDYVFSSAGQYAKTDPLPWLPVNTLER